MVLMKLLTRLKQFWVNKLSNLFLKLIKFFPPELAHNITIKLLKFSFKKKILIDNPILNQHLLGLDFSNPIGLAAGFDKNGVGAGLWNYFGFGFAELGTITWHAQEGNPKPRLFRIAKEKAALNRMGFNNQGAENFLKTIVIYLQEK